MLRLKFAPLPQKFEAAAENGTGVASAETGNYGPASKGNCQLVAFVALAQRRTAVIQQPFYRPCFIRDVVGCHGFSFVRVRNPNIARLPDRYHPAGIVRVDHDVALSQLTFVLEPEWHHCASTGNVVACPLFPSGRAV